MCFPRKGHLSERIDAQKLQSGAAPVNPQFHDEFVALCALFYSGEISEEEWALLQIHMAYCDSCQETFQQYQTITSDVIPAMAAVAASEASNGSKMPTISIEEAERKLMMRLDAAPADEKTLPKHKPRVWFPVLLIAASVVGLTCLIGFSRVLFKNESSSQASIEKPLREIQAPVQPAVAPTDAQQELKRTQDDLANVQHQLSDTQGQLKQSNLALAVMENQLKEEQTARNEVSEQRDSLNQQLASAKNQLDALGKKSTTTAVDTAQQSQQIEKLEAKVEELNAAIEDKDTALGEKDRMLALDQDFLAHDRDIRDLIGARNLYIADIFDTGQDGKAAKQFGRIFYTKDRSLVFYGFDLDKQAGLRRDATFQVWGSGSDKPPVSLGLFYEDDKNKRWILRCNDAKALARLDMVFVTVEPPGGSAKPTGKQLLRAYLQIPPNHP
jgi:hypothetical protein